MSNAFFARTLQKSGGFNHVMREEVDDSDHLIIRRSLNGQSDLAAAE